MALEKCPDSAGALEMCPVKGMCLMNPKVAANAGGCNEMLGHRLFLGESGIQGMKVFRMSFHRAWCLN